MSESFRQNTRNAVLVKDDVGKARPSVYDLPEEGFAYGRAEPADMEGAREVTMHWAAHVPRPKPGGEHQDLIKINKMAAKANVTNAKDLANFRVNNDVKLVYAGPQGPMPKVIPSDVIPSFAYGRRSRPSTPIAAIVGYQYGAESEELLDANYKQLEWQRAGKKSHMVKMTKSIRANISGARMRRVESERRETCPEPPELFKLTKFKKVRSRVMLPSFSKSASSPAIQGSSAQGEYGDENYAMTA